MAAGLVALLVCRSAVTTVGAADGAAHSPSAASFAHLQATLRQDVQAQPAGTLSISYRDLSTGQTIALGDQQPWEPASLVKLFVMAAAYHQRAGGVLDFNAHVTVTAANVVPTAGFDDGDYPGLYGGITTTIGTLVAMMIRQSDNTAYNTLLDLLDPRKVTDYIHSLGLTHTTVARKLNLDGAALELDSERSHNAVNTTTVADVAALYLMLYDGKIPLAGYMLGLLERQKQNYMLPAGLPAGAVVAHKPGEVGDSLRHDGGIVRLAGGGAFLLVVFSALGSYSELSGIAAQVAQAYPPAPPGTGGSSALEETPEGSRSLAVLLRLLLALAAAALLLLVFGLDRGLIGGRPRHKKQP